MRPVVRMGSTPVPDARIGDDREVLERRIERVHALPRAGADDHVSVRRPAHGHGLTDVLGARREDGTDRPDRDRRLRAGRTRRPTSR